LPLIISDHCDWGELNQSIQDSGASTIWVTHGREDALVYWCKKLGLEAEPLALPGLDDDGGEGGE
jgi:putative mRNA 3-end processing factor